MAFRTETFEIIALHEDLAPEHVAAHSARERKEVLADLARRGYRPGRTFRTRTYRIGGFFEFRTRSDVLG
ncbi:hypothetical protein MOQ72_34205 [Saccharopolyspora sp. K220]|uniref:hypothetical protein n=1 Tax=Saccharopolyspora soli TaxID=2926618 RepID=UPI001F56A4F0|nr:hypothetical protein [Saccharopolyspora soli]MCI2422493.1 hypothetical protein [Saccharopolyspora soli]